MRADSWADLGFGQGWAAARDNLPTIADQVLKVRSERALHFGAGPLDGHLASDFGYLALGVVEAAPSVRDAQEPRVRDLVRGYTAGINAWLAEARDPASAEALPEWCRDAAWIRPVTELDLYALYGDLVLLASGRNLVGYAGRAEAPGPDGPVPPSPLGAGFGGDEPHLASNGWALGRDRTADGRGLVLANPHFPWTGEARFWEVHLTIPGELDVYGVALLGSPGVQIGFNEAVAWTHTVSNGNRFTVYKVDLDPDDPTRYRSGDEWRAMTPADHEVQVRRDDGTVDTVRRTLWHSHFGPMLNMPLMGWGTEIGFTYRDANAANTRFLPQFIGMDTARSLDEFQEVFRTVGGIPWVNTVAADAAGRCWYFDGSPTPNLSAEAGERFVEAVSTDPITALLYSQRAVLLDGSDPAFEWVDDPAAAWPGIEPHDRLPGVERSDFVANANDSHWLSNPAQPLEGYSPFHGFERTPRTLRTRQNLRLLTRDGTPERLTPDDLVRLLFANESLSAELLRDEVVARCRAAGTVDHAGAAVDVAHAADVLEAWDGCFGLESRGAALWRETLAGYTDEQLLDGPALWADQFEPHDPVATPRGLAPAPPEGPDPVVLAVARAVVDLGVAGVALDARLGDIQWADRGPHRVPVHGGQEWDGVANILGPLGALPSTTLVPRPPLPAAVPGRSERSGLRQGGYPVDYGVSFVMVAGWDGDGPVAQGILAYGQSGDPASPHHLDQTLEYAAGRLRPLLFRDADIEADPNLERRTVTG